jgi:two-component system, NarL family, nitrate/nitrite response regulator NarL
MGCLVKTAAPTNLVQGVRAVSGDHCVLSPDLLDLYVAPYRRAVSRPASMPEQHVRSRQLNSLTTREREILELIADGASTEDISSLLAVSASTVKSHISHALTKLGARNRLEAVLLMRGEARRRPRGFKLTAPPRG